MPLFFIRYSVEIHHRIVKLINVNGLVPIDRIEFAYQQINIARFNGSLVSSRRVEFFKRSDSVINMFLPEKQYIVRMIQGIFNILYVHIILVKRVVIGNFPRMKIPPA